MNQDTETLFNGENRIEMLKRRTNRCVCHYCGGKLELRRIMFNDVEEARVEIFCPDCNRIEFGVEQAVYGSASHFVDAQEFDMFTDMDDNEKKRQMNIAKVCDIFTWGCKDLGVLNQEGFSIPVKESKNDWAECLVLSGEELAQLDTEE